MATYLLDFDPRAKPYLILVFFGSSESDLAIFIVDLEIAKRSTTWSTMLNDFGEVQNPKAENELFTAPNVNGKTLQKIIESALNI